MQRASVLLWYSLLGIFTLMGLVYFWFTLFPSTLSADIFSYFTLQQIKQGQEYSRALRISFILSLFAQCAWMSWLAFCGHGSALSDLVTRGNPGKPVLSSLIFFFLIWLSLQIINFPFTYFSSFVWQQQWGFSTQTFSAWLYDYIKSTGLELLFAGIGAWLLIYAIHRLPNIWWLAAAGFLSTWIVISSYLWPVVVSPLFNTFTPASNPAVTSMVKQLADKAGLPVNEVLIMDASRRTTRANAYFAGVGKTRRVVLYDTLLQDYPADEVESVVAHELAHWRQGHITQGLLWGIAGSFIGWGLLYFTLRISLPALTFPPPHMWLFILLFFLLGSFITSPLQNAISRHMEREADSVAVALTENSQAAVRLQIHLAAKNLSDVAPHPYLRLFSTHPPAIERITAVSNIR